MFLPKRFVLLSWALIASCYQLVGAANRFFEHGNLNPIAKTLVFDSSKYESLSYDFEGKMLRVRSYEHISYVSSPVDSSRQVMNIYIPEEYFSGVTLHGYTAATAPIFFPNRIGGYMPADPMSFRVSDQNQVPSRSLWYAISRGYIVASAGARGRVSKDASGKLIGKAPAVIVDLKAAIRYLKYNDRRMPGDASKIISNGTSAGGAVSTIIGATGNHPDYEAYLAEIGAAKAKDDLFAVSAYCPISNLENADMAYEWQLSPIHSFDFRGRKGELSESDIRVSLDLKNAFPAYLNQLHLKNEQGAYYSLNEEGNGNFKELVENYILKSAQKAIDQGGDLSMHAFLQIEQGKVKAVDFNAYMRYIGRMKTPPAFDGLSNQTFENNLFGNEKIENRHFTSYSLSHSKVDMPQLADSEQIKMMNPMNYISDSKASIAQNWRIRHGGKDRDTGFAVPIMLATLLENQGFSIDFALAWDKPHSGDYDLVELFDWMDKLCKK